MSKGEPPRKADRNVLQYTDDVELANTRNFIAVINARQKRSHVIVRTLRDTDAGISNNLFQFSDELHNEFWFIIQQVVHILKVPAILCHHFGNWRSADHFHVHIVLHRDAFSEIASKKSPTPIAPSEITQMFNNKLGFLIKRCLGWKNDEIKLIEAEKSKPETERRKHDTAETNFEGFRIEFHPSFARINFIYEKPLVYSTDPNEVSSQLQQNRRHCFDAMCKFAEKHNFHDFRTWIKLTGDPLRLNDGRKPEDQIFGILQVYSPDYYFLHPDSDRWLEAFKTSNYDILSCL